MTQTKRNFAKKKVTISMKVTCFENKKKKSDKGEKMNNVQMNTQ